MRKAVMEQFTSELPEAALPKVSREETMGKIIPFPENIARSPEKRNVANHIVAALQEIEEQKGKPGIEAILALLRERGPAITPEDVEDSLEQIGDVAELRTDVLQYMEDKKIIEYGPKGEMIMDLEKFKTAGINSALRNSRAAYNRKGKFKSFADKGQPFLLYSALEDEQVISRDDWEKGERKTKPLFYGPVAKFTLLFKMTQAM